MLKTACLLTGDNYCLLSADTPGSKKKVVATALSMLVPTLIWLFNGFMLSYEVLDSDLKWSILTGFVCGMIIFLIEKLIVMANGSKLLYGFRIGIGVIVALLGSISFDEVVFKSDIDISVVAIKELRIIKSKKDAASNFEKLNDYEGLNSAIVKAQVNYDKAVRDVKEEAQGATINGKRGNGPVARLLKGIANDRKSDLDKLVTNKNELASAKENVSDTASLIAAKSFNEHALLTRIKALFLLVTQDYYMLITYILFTLLLFVFEFLVIILKMTCAKTNYERKIEMIEDIGRRRMELLQRPNSMLLDPGNFLKQFEPTRELIKKNISIYN